MRIRRTFGTIAVALAFSSLTYGQRPAPPQTPQRPVTDEYFGIKVVDPYRWLENWDDPEVRAWTEAQNSYTRAQLDAQPFAETVRQRVRAVGSSASPRWSALTSRPGALFTVKYQPPLDQPPVVVMPPTADPAAERVMVDPNRLDTSGLTTSDSSEAARAGMQVAAEFVVGG